MIRFLLDTNICIELIRRRRKPVLRQLRAQQVGAVGISSITLAELQHGVAGSREPERNRLALAQFVAPLEVLAFDDHAALAYGRVRMQLEAMGTPIGPLDTLIAAHALAVEATLITNNLREFARVEGLRLADWTAEA